MIHAQRPPEGSHRPDSPFPMTLPPARPSFVRHSADAFLSQRGAGGIRGCLALLIAGVAAATCVARDLSPVVGDVQRQPLAAQVRRVVQAEEYLGNPFSPEERHALQEAFDMADPQASVNAIQRVLDPHCLVDIDISPEMRVKVSAGPAKPVLLEQGWRQFLVKVHNQAGTTAPLRCVSPEGQSLSLGGDSLTPGAPKLKNASDERYRTTGWPSDAELGGRWVDVAMYDGQPLVPELGGLSLEYRILEVYSRDAGKREATLAFDIGQGTQDLGFRSELPVVFESLPAQRVVLHIRDESGRPTFASVTVMDAQGRTYPSQAKRTAPDFAFQPQVYRGDGETLGLAAGNYTVTFSRGPESIPQKRSLSVGEGATEVTYRSMRWIDAAALGWWSGDHHIHAAGCLHYLKPTEGVAPQDMIRQVIGEDLKVGACLTWGPALIIRTKISAAPPTRPPDSPTFCATTLRCRGSAPTGADIWTSWG